MRVPSVEPGVIPGRRRWRIHADHLLGKTFPLLPPPYYKQTAWNNPNCSGLWSLAPTVRKRKVRRKWRRTKEAGRYRRCTYYRWRQPWALWQSVNVKSRTRTVGAVASTDDRACPLTTTTTSSNSTNSVKTIRRRESWDVWSAFQFFHLLLLLFLRRTSWSSKKFSSTGFSCCWCSYPPVSRLLLRELCKRLPVVDLGKVLRRRSCRRHRQATPATRKGKKEGICKWKRKGKKSRW